VNVQSTEVHRAAGHLASLVRGGEVTTRVELERAKKSVSRAYRLDRYVSNSEILCALPADNRPAFEALLRVHPRRSASGIVVVTAFSAPFSCPHGTCVFCPGGPRAGTPQSYMPASPGMRVALEAEFDPYRQVELSLAKYHENGHGTDKVETIIEGGTFIALERNYQRAFVQGVYEGLNGTRAHSLSEAQRANESTASRCVGLTLESKPDWCRPEHVDLMLEYGITRLEIGVQSLRNEVLARNNRGHTVEDSIRAFQVARDAGLKVTAHMMPGLPGSDPKQDLEDLRRIFEDGAFRPDMTKLYPTLVVEGTALERLAKLGEYESYSTETVVDLLSDMKRFVPRWHRIMRIQREIPAYEITGGVKEGNLRELVLARAREKGVSCRCIRCREVALSDPGAFEEQLELKVEKYPASGGDELFMSYEYPREGRIAGFVRLRVPSEAAHRPEANGAAIIRELRVYGRVVGVGERDGHAWQHRGLGRSLMSEAERAALEQYGARRVLVTAAVGTRDYYRKLGYHRDGPYMAKAVQAGRE
jgi:elongator complex protein 3 (tRNA carboxymethyluridine synthase)